MPLRATLPDSIMSRGAIHERRDLRSELLTATDVYVYKSETNWGPCLLTVGSQGITSTVENHVTIDPDHMVRGSSSLSEVRDLYFLLSFDVIRHCFFARSLLPRVKHIDRDYS